MIKASLMEWKIGSVMLQITALRTLQLILEWQRSHVCTRKRVEVMSAVSDVREGLYGVGTVKLSSIDVRDESDQVAVSVERDHSGASEILARKGKN
jgi:hypothetical protein